MSSVSSKKTQFYTRLKFTNYKISTKQQEAAAQLMSRATTTD